MKSKLLKCLSIGITAAMLAVSVIPLSAPTVLAEDEQNYYAYFTLPEKDTDDMTYSIYQIAYATSYESASGFVKYQVNPDFASDLDGRALFKIDDQGRLIYVKTDGSTEVLFDVDNFAEAAHENNYVYNRDLLDAAARVADIIETKETTTPINAYNNDVEQTPGAGSFEAKEMKDLANGLKVKLVNGLYIMIGKGGKITSPNIIPVANYETLEPDASTSKQLDDKGSDITVDKTITAVGTGTNEQNVTDNAMWGTKASDGNSAEVRVGSKVSFMIDSMTPSYDTSVQNAINNDSFDALLTPDPEPTNSDTGIVDYVIYDDPSPSLTIDMDTVKVSVANLANVGKAASAVPGGGWIEVNETNVGDFVVGAQSAAATSVADIMTVEKIEAGNLGDNPFVGDAYSMQNGGAGFKVVFTDKFIVNQMDRAVKVEFDATVNDTLNSKKLDGTVNGYEMPNTGLVQYDNVYTDGQRDATVHLETVELYRITIEIDKVDGEGAAMQNVGFTIYNADGDVAVTKEQLTGTDGTITFDELPAGTYVLKETPQKGYQTAPDITFTITAGPGSSGGYSGVYTLDVTNPASGVEFTNGVLSLVPNALKIVNYKGQVLPGTGGMGTVIFTVVGVGVIVLAGVLLVVYMRKRRVDED